MSIAINESKCIGCGKCLYVCPGNLIKSNEQGKVYIKYPRDCWGCASCIKECHHRAIALYLGADIGGRGSKLTVQHKGDLIHWRIENNNEEVGIIEIDKTSSNKY